MKKETSDKIKRFFTKFWHLLWKDNSFKGWIFSLIFLFLFVKFIFFPFLSLTTGTSLPLAIVDSCSMYHENDIFSNFDIWWEEHEEKYAQFNITKEEFEKFRFKSGLNKGDILFITDKSAEKIKIGDIIIFDADQKNPIIHRVVNITQNNGEYIFSTIGDNNNAQLISEKKIHQNQIIGKTQLKLSPYLGWVKLIFFESQRPEFERGLCEEN